MSDKIDPSSVSCLVGQAKRPMIKSCNQAHSLGYFYYCYYYYTLMPALEG
jgi:hypothetical protein